MADEPTLGEVNRNVTDLRAEVRALRSEVVHRDVYAANRTADELRVKAVEADLRQMTEDRAALRRLIWAAMLTAGSSVVAQLVIAAFNSKP